MSILVRVLAMAVCYIQEIKIPLFQSSYPVGFFHGGSASLHLRLYIVRLSAFIAIEEAVRSIHGRMDWHTDKLLRTLTPGKSLNHQNAVVQLPEEATIGADALIVEHEGIAYDLERLKAQDRVAYGRVVTGIGIGKGKCRRHVQRATAHALPVAIEVVRPNRPVGFRTTDKNEK